jgi:hypothetical protein
MASSEGEDICIICRENLVDEPQIELVLMECGHVFHYPCMENMILCSNPAQDVLCPLCRFVLKRATNTATTANSSILNIETRNIVPNILIQNENRILIILVMLLVTTFIGLLILICVMTIKYTKYRTDTYNYPNMP